MMTVYDDAEPGIAAARDPRDVADVFRREEPPPSMAPDRCIEVECPPEGSPPLIVVSDRRLTSEGVASIRRALQDSLESRRDVLVDAGLTVYQLLGGRWWPLCPIARESHAPPR